MSKAKDTTRVLLICKQAGLHAHIRISHTRRHRPEAQAEPLIDGETNLQARAFDMLWASVRRDRQARRPDFQKKNTKTERPGLGAERERRGANDTHVGRVLEKQGGGGGKKKKKKKELGN